MKKRIVVMLIILQLIHPIYASPTFIASSIGKISSFFSSGSMGRMLADLAKMTHYLEQLNVLSREQNEKIEDIYLAYNRTTSGRTYRDYVSNLVPANASAQYGIWSNISDLQSKYTKVNVVANAEGAASSTYDEFVEWLITPDDQLKAEKIKEEQLRQSISLNPELYAQSGATLVSEEDIIEHAKIEEHIHNEVNEAYVDASMHDDDQMEQLGARGQSQLQTKKLNYIQKLMAISNQKLSNLSTTTEALKTHEDYKKIRDDNDREEFRKTMEVVKEELKFKKDAAKLMSY